MTFPKIEHSDSISQCYMATPDNMPNSFPHPYGFKLDKRKVKEVRVRECIDETSFRIVPTEGSDMGTFSFRISKIKENKNPLIPLEFLIESTPFN